MKDKEQLRNLILNGISQDDLDNNYDYSQITDMSYMFQGCKSLERIEFLQINTKNVKTMDEMFLNCINLEYVAPLETYNVLIYSPRLKQGDSSIDKTS